LSTIAFTLAGIVLLGVGVPLLWVWAASMLAGDDRHLTSALAIFTATGILVTYWVALVVAGMVRSRWVTEEDERSNVRRASWNRSFRDEPLEYGKERMDPIERVFILTAVLGIIVFEVWFLFFAGSPLAGFPQ
jgi:type VI protein secretion system component VasK